MGDLCYHCDGTGERDFLSGARCYECDGTGWIEDRDFDEDPPEDDVWQLENQSPQEEPHERE